MATSVQHLLVNETKESHEYDPEKALRLWALLVPEIPENDNRGYTEWPDIDDEGRIISLFELLDGSILGDMVFGSLDFDQGSVLTERAWGE